MTSITFTTGKFKEEKLLHGLLHSCRLPGKHLHFHCLKMSKLNSILSYKAESAGRVVIEVDSKNTSQKCSSCGRIVPKKLSERWHNCPYCHYSEHRDVNAAKNILMKAVA